MASEESVDKSEESYGRGMGGTSIGVEDAQTRVMRTIALSPSGDTTGFTDSNNLRDAVKRIQETGGQIIFGKGEYYLSSPHNPTER